LNFDVDYQGEYMVHKEIYIELQDTQWQFDYIDHDRNIARAIVYDENGIFYIKLIYWDLPNRQTTICFTNFNIKLNLIALIKTRIINHSALHYHQVPKKCPTSPPTILPVFMRLCRLFILFILKSHFPHS
jgi:hypothetical protein